MTELTNLDAVRMERVREFHAAVGGCDWECLTPWQRSNWVRLYQGEQDWDGNPITSPELGAVVELRQDGRS